MVANMQGKSTSHISQERSQMSWYEEHWLEGKALPEEKLDELDIQDLQQIRTEAEKHLEKITNAYEHREFYAQERDRIKSKIGTKLQQQMKELEKDLELLNQ